MLEGTALSFHFSHGRKIEHFFSRNLMNPRAKAVKTEVKTPPNPYGILKEAPPFPDDLSPKAQLKWAKIAPAACAVGTFSGADIG